MQDAAGHFDRWLTPDEAPSAICLIEGGRIKAYKDKRINVAVTSKWIMSEGGPLIAMDADLQGLWGGVSRLTVARPSAAHDYDRPPSKLKYLQNIDLQKGSALIFGEGPLDTAFWQSPAGILFIIRIVYCKDEFDIEQIMSSIDSMVFDPSQEALRFSFQSDNIVIFDSAEDGLSAEKSYIAAPVNPGLYRIVTQTHEPNAETLLVLHRFDRIV